MERELTFMIPYEALREAVAHALIHRVSTETGCFSQKFKFHFLRTGLSFNHLGAARWIDWRGSSEADDFNAAKYEPGCCF